MKSALDYIVKVENFEGPMDLLIELIRKREMDVYDLQISHITNDFMKTIETMKQHNIEVTSDFMELASTLLRIKAKMLIPIEVEKEDPRSELVKQILDFQAQKEATERLQILKQLEMKLFKRQKQEKIKQQKKGTLQDIIKSYQSIFHKKFSSNKNERFDEMNKETNRYKFTIEERMDFLLTVLEENRVEVQTYFSNIDDKEELIETFGALLELVKVQAVSIYIENDETIYIEKRSDTNG